jgi:hypothetical protein
MTLHWTITTGTRFLPKTLPALLLLMALSLAAQACGGGDGGEAQQNAPEPTQAPTQPPEISSPSQPSSGTEEIFIRASSDNGFTLTLTAGDVVELDYTVESRIQGRSESGGNVGGIASGVQFAVTDPSGNVIFQAEQLSQNQASITVQVSGEHTFSFINSFRAQGQSVTANYAINP